MRDFIKEIQYKQSKLLDLKVEINKLKADLKEAVKLTNKFLFSCSNRNITRVSIARETTLVPASLNFPFGASNSVFQFPGYKDINNGKDGVGIWEALEENNIHGGCGNGDQHQVYSDVELIEGVYEFKKGKWYRVEDEE